jgi:hypothetical protein
MELEKSAEQVLPGSKESEEMTQTMYAHVNK